MQGTLPPTLDQLLTHERWVRAVARGLLFDETEVDDVVQEVWMAALHQGPRDAGAVRGWLGSTTRNLANRFRRREGRLRKRERSAAQPEGLAPAGALVEQVAARRAVCDAVLALEEPYRATVLWRYFGERSCADIARERGEPEGTVRSRLKRGLDQLRAAMDRAHAGDRRVWSLALVPVAVLGVSGAASAAAGTAGPIAALTPAATVGGGAAMTLGAKISMGLVAAALLLVAAVPLLQGDRAADAPAVTPLTTGEVGPAIVDVAAAPGEPAPLPAIAELPADAGGPVEPAPAPAAAPEPPAEPAPASTPPADAVVRTITGLEAHVVDRHGQSVSDVVFQARWVVGKGDNDHARALGTQSVAASADGRLTLTLPEAITGQAEPEPRLRVQVWITAGPYRLAGNSPPLINPYAAKPQVIVARNPGIEFQVIAADTLIPIENATVEDAHTTRREGGWVTAFAPPESGSVTVRAPGFVPQGVAMVFEGAGVTRRDDPVALARGYVIQGTAVDGHPERAGTPIQVQVIAEAMGGDPADPEFVEAPGHADGTWALPPMDIGEYRVMWFARGRAPRSAIVRLGRATEERTVTMTVRSEKGGTARPFRWPERKAIRIPLNTSDLGALEAMTWIEEMVGVQLERGEGVDASLSNTRVSISFSSTPVGSALQFFADIAGLEFDADAGVLTVPAPPNPPAAPQTTGGGKK